MGQSGVMGKPMKITLKYVISDNDRHGNLRYYVRAPGQKKHRLRAAPGTNEFVQEYQEAMAGVQKTGAAAIKPGSFRHLCVKYFGSKKFRLLDNSTQSWQRRSLEGICAAKGHLPLARMESRHVRQIRNEKEETPAAANMRMKAMRAMFSWANEEEEFHGNPTLGVKNIKYVERGHHSWTLEEVEQYRARHKLGTKARVALDLIVYTTGRREDIPRFGPQHFKNGRIKYRQGKNDKRAPIDIDIPIHAELQKSIDACQTKHLTYLVTEFGKPFSTNGFGNKFKDWCRQAGLPHCSAHGVRKHTAARLAESDATPHQIGAVTGHQSLEEIERYTKAARRPKLADEAMAKLKR
jgi:integrase/recombinase XerD